MNTNDFCFIRNNYRNNYFGINSVNNKRFMKRIFFGLFLFINSFCFAQVIGGTVTDSINQAGIANAKVVVKNLNSGYTDSVFTNSSGNWNYNFPTSLNDDDISPSEFVVAHNYPNPFNPSTNIEFILPQTGKVQILIHNMLGQLIDSREQFLNAGNYSIRWDANGSAGVYFYTIRNYNQSITNKMILLDGGNGAGLSEIRFGNKIQNKSVNKTISIQVAITFSKFAYVSKTINSSINGGEYFYTNLITIHHNSLMIDLHNDILERMAANPSYQLGVLNSIYHTDIPRLKKGGVDVQFFSVWVSPSLYPNNPFTQSQVMINILNNQINLNQSTIGLARNTQEALALTTLGKIAAVIGVEGGHTIENDLNKLAQLYNQGMRYMTITWNNSTSWAVSAQDPRSATVGLSEFGKSVIRAMDSLGIIIDVSHTGIKTIQDILQITTKPIIASHSGVRALRNHYRNLYDNQIIAIANSGGVIGVVFYPPFLTSSSSANIDTVIKHIDYIKNLVGIDYVALGSDFDGIETTPIGLEDVSKFPALTLRLLERGYSQQDLEKILGGNFMRVFEQVCGNKKILNRNNY